MTSAARTALATEVKRRGPETVAGDDGYDLAWYRSRALAEPERRAAKAKPLAADLTRCVGADDAEGVRQLLHRVTDWPALAVVLAECASPGRVAVVCGRPASRRASAARKGAA